MGSLLWLAAALVAVWIVLAVVVHVAGFAVHLLLFAAAIALMAWGVRQFQGRSSRTPLGP